MNTSTNGMTHLAGAALLVLVLHFTIAGVLRPLLRPYAWSDFASFYSAARAFADDTSPYELESLQETGQPEFRGWIGRYLYPPPFAAVVIRPLLLLPFDAARRVWVVVEAAAYLLASMLLAQIVFGDLRPGALAALGFLALPFAPFHFDLKLGSVSGLLLLLLVLFLRERQRGHLGRAAWALGASMVLKLSPALVLLYLVGRGEVRLALRSIVAALAVLVAALPWTGVQVYADYITGVVPVLATQDFSWFTNQSVDAFFWRLFVPNDNTTPWLASPALQRACTSVVSIGILGGLGLLVVHERRRATTEPDAALWGPACVLVASLLLARVTWEYMLVLALPCFALWLRDVAQERVRGRGVVVMALAFAMCALPMPYTEEPMRSGLGLLLEAPRFYGLVLAFAASVVYRLRGA